MGMIAAAYPITEMLTALVFGALADKYGRKPFIVGGLVLSTVVLPLFSLTKNFVLLVIIHAIQGIAAAMIVVSTLALIADHAKVNLRGREMGVYDFANIGGYIIGPFAAGLLIHQFSIVAPFYVASILALVGAVVAQRTIIDFRGDSEEKHASPLEVLTALWKTRRTASMFPIWLAITIFVGIALTFLPRLVASPLQAGSAFAVVGLALAFTQPFFGYLSDKYGRDRIMAVGILSVVGLFFTMIPFVQGLISSTLAFPLLGLFGMGSFAFVPAALALLADYAPAQGRGIAMGAYSLILSLGAIIGPLAGGVVLDRFGLTGLLYFAAMILIAALGVAAAISRPFALTNARAK